MTSKSITKNIQGYLFISPWLIGFLFFMLAPSLWSVFLAFTDYNFLQAPHWTGLDNFNRMIHQPIFTKSLSVTFIHALISVPVHLGTALLAAMALNAKLKGITFYRVMYYMPSFIGGSIGVAIMWKMVLSNSGAVNSILKSLGLPGIHFFGVHSALYTLSFMSAWTLGSAMLIFLAGLQQIPAELHESAKVDGAGPVRRFFSITLPLLTPVMLFNLILGIIGALQAFTGAFVITAGGPVKSTYFFVLYLYEEAFKFYRMGYASMLAWTLFIIIMLITMLTLKSSSAWVFYESEMKGGKR